MVKKPPANAGDVRDGFNPCVEKILWRKEQQSTPVFLPGESHGQWSLAGYMPQGRKQLDTTKASQCAHTHTHTTYYVYSMHVAYTIKYATYTITIYLGVYTSGMSTTWGHLEMQNLSLISDLLKYNLHF